jgi:parallel beta-helix repeat protein
MMGLVMANVSQASITCSWTTWDICGDNVNPQAETGDTNCPNSFQNIPCECGDDVRSSTNLDPGDDPVVDGSDCSYDGLSILVKSGIVLNCQGNTLNGDYWDYGTGLTIGNVANVQVKKCGNLEFFRGAAIYESDLITVDCDALWRGNGHSSYNSYGDGFAIDNVTTSTIKNCNVQEFYDGFHATESDALTLLSDRAKFNYNDGIHFDNVTSSTVKGSYSQDNWEDGIELHQNDGNTVTNTRIERNAYGVYMNDAHSDTITKNQINENYYQGVLLAGDSDGNVISDNVVKKNYQGIVLTDDADGNTVSGNTASENYEEGIEVEPPDWGYDSPDGNFILSNTVEKNGGEGIDIESSGNTVFANAGQKNGNNGLEVDDGTSNVLTNNKFNQNGGHGICTEVGTATNGGGNTGSGNLTPPNVIFNAATCDLP